MSRDTVEVKLPSSLQNWTHIKELLLGLVHVESLNTSLKILDKLYFARHGHNDQKPTSQQKGGRKTKGKKHSSQTVPDYSKVTMSPFSGLVRYIEQRCSDQDQKHFVSVILPTIARYALEIEEVGTLYLAKQQIPSVTRLPRHLVASIVCSQFLCLFDERNRRDKSALLNETNFSRYFNHLSCGSQMVKIKSFFAYIDQISQTKPTGEIIYVRKVLPKKEVCELKDWLGSSHKLCNVKVHDGDMEDTGRNTLQIDFANRQIGGGVLGRGAVQEEIKFSMCPELIASMSFMETMMENEAITIQGFRQFAYHSGYRDTLKYEGPCYDIDDSPAHTICAMDAKGVGRDRNLQFTEPLLIRELNKSYVGFNQANGSLTHTVHNWHCSSNSISRNIGPWLTVAAHPRFKPKDDVAESMQWYHDLIESGRFRSDVKPIYKPESAAEGSDHLGDATVQSAACASKDSGEDPTSEAVVNPADILTGDEANAVLSTGSVVSVTSNTDTVVKTNANSAESMQLECTGGNNSSKDADPILMTAEGNSLNPDELNLSDISIHNVHVQETPTTIIDSDIMPQNAPSGRLDSKNDSQQACMSSDEGAAAMAGTCLEQEMRTIATGNWGCGAFGGNHQLKAIIQWCSASQCDTPLLIYCSFRDERVQNLSKVVQHIEKMNWKVGTLLGAVLRFSKLLLAKKNSGELFDYLLSCKH